MKIVIVGFGSIGQRHAAILSAMGHEVFVLRRQALGNALGIKEIDSWTQVDAIKPDVAFICTPTNTHIPIAMECARRGMHLFIEKPLSDRIDGVEGLQDLCAKNNLTAYVGYGLRFHPVIEELKAFLSSKQVHHARIVCTSFLHRWRANDVKNYSYYQNQGGGAIFDLSHEFDYAAYLFGDIEHISGRWGRRSSVTVDSEDFADALLTTRTQVPINVHINFLSEHDERRVSVDFDGGFIEGDLLNGQMRWNDQHGHGQKQVDVDRNRYLTKQSQYFFEHIGKANMMNNIAQASQLLDKILQFKNQFPPLC